jgi:CubicO group peptidase (beta-lactamase class C family)
MLGHLRLRQFALALIMASAVRLPADGQISSTARTKPLQSLDAARLDTIFAAFSGVRTPGCALGVYDHGATRYARGFGLANLQRGSPITPRTVFEVMSVTKQFTAAAVALLVHDGKLRLDDDVRRWLPELPPPSGDWPLTVRDLIQHTSGLRDVGALLRLAGRIPSDSMNVVDVLRLLGRQRGMQSQPGERFAYDNTNYSLLALLVERVSGEPLRRFAARRIFEPLRMRATRFGTNVDPKAAPNDVAIGYAPRPDSTWEPSLISYAQIGAYGLLTSVEDLARWESSFRSGILGDSVITTMRQTPGQLRGGKPLEYAFGLAAFSYRGLRVVQHTGSGAGYRSTFMRFPNQGVAMAVLCNSSTASSYALALRVADVLLDGVMGPRERESPASRQTSAVADRSAPIAVPDSVLRRLAGTYWDSTTISARRVRVSDGRVMMVSGAVPFEVRPSPWLDGPKDGWRFLAVPDPRIAYDFTPSPNSGHFHLRRTLPDAPTEEYEWRDDWNPSAGELADYAGAYHSVELDATWRLDVRDRQLIARRSPEDSTMLLPQIHDEFRAGPMFVSFLRNTAGLVDRMSVTVGAVRAITFVRCSGAGCSVGD